MKRISGVVSGVVKSLEDPNGQGRVQLEFPYFPGGPTSSWAPVASALAGNGRGAFLMPEKDDEVLVSFEQGDVNHPYIVGFLWNGVDKPPESDPKNRVILTPGGHTLRFEDGDNAKKIVLQSSSGHKITLDDTAAGQTITLQTSKNLSITLNDTDQSITLNGGGRILAMRSGTLQIT